MKKLIFLSSLLALCILPSNANAWKIARVKGEASIIRNGSIIEAKKGTRLEIGDIIVTKRRARVSIREKSSKVLIGSHTKFTIQNTIGTSKNSKSKVLNLLYGKVRASIDKETAKMYNYKTKSAVAGVRGTEFFFASDDTQDLFCTLEGSIEVNTDSGASVVVNEGQGLKLTGGDTPSLSDNSNALVDLWIAQTSFEDRVIDMNAYATEKRHHKLENSNFTYGGFGSVYWCANSNTDFNSWGSSSVDDKVCWKAMASPFIQYGKKNKFFFRPAVYHVANNFESNIDNFPVHKGKELTSATIAELYGEASAWDWKLRVGLQDVKWADGVLLSRQNWTNEPRTHLALRAFGQWGDWGVEFLGGPGLEEDQPLKGYTHIKTLGLKFDAPKNWGSLYFLHTNFGDLESGQSPYHHGHEINHIGLFSQKKLGPMDYSFSSINQKHVIHHDAAGTRGEVDGTMFDIGAGYHIGTSMPARISLRALRASDNFIPILEDYYKLGASGVVNVRANLEQIRFKVEVEPWENHGLYFEYLSNTEVNANGFVRQLATTKHGEKIGDEIDLIYRLNWKPHWSFMFGYWQFSPGAGQTGNDDSTGYVSRLEYNY